MIPSVSLVENAKYESECHLQPSLVPPQVVLFDDSWGFSGDEMYVTDIEGIKRPL